MQAGITTKTNTVLLAENREEWAEIAALAQEFPIYVRFIEQMPLGQGIMDEQHTAQAVLEQLAADGATCGLPKHKIAAHRRDTIPAANLWEPLASLRR